MSKKLMMCNRCGFFYLTNTNERFCSRCQKYNKRFDMKAHYLRREDIT